MSERRRNMWWAGALAAVTTLVAVLVACEREEKPFHTKGTAKQGVVRESPLQPGEHQPEPEVKNPYEENAWALNEGKLLYKNFNCVGCHANGGGGMGVPLMDDQWMYGSSPEQVVSSILEGRPNGMPSFAGKVTDQQAWMLGAYVRSLAGLTGKTAAPGRGDELQTKPAEQSMPTQDAKDVATPPIPKAPG
jgi:cytochrome c oxidase cbb3-type subunit 3